MGYSDAVGCLLESNQLLLQDASRRWVSLIIIKGSVVRSHNAILRFSALGRMPRRTSWYLNALSLFIGFIDRGKQKSKALAVFDRI